MSGPNLSANLRRFIVARIPSVPVLEALLLLRSRASTWAIADLAARLYVSNSSARSVLEELDRQGMATFDGEVAQYAPRAEEAQMLEELASVYSCRLVEVTQLIHSTTQNKAQRFADAFVVRKEPR